MFTPLKWSYLELMSWSPNEKKVQAAVVNPQKTEQTSGVSLGCKTPSLRIFTFTVCAFRFCSQKSLVGNNDYHFSVSCLSHLFLQGYLTRLLFYTCPHLTKKVFEKKTEKPFSIRNVFINWYDFYKDLLVSLWRWVPPVFLGPDIRIFQSVL